MQILPHSTLVNLNVSRIDEPKSPSHINDEITDNGTTTAAAAADQIRQTRSGLRFLINELTFLNPDSPLVESLRKVDDSTRRRIADNVAVAKDPWMARSILKKVASHMLLTLSELCRSSQSPSPLEAVLIPLAINIAVPLLYTPPPIDAKRIEGLEKLHTAIKRNMEDPFRNFRCPCATTQCRTAPGSSGSPTEEYVWPPFEVVFPPRNTRKQWKKLPSAPQPPFIQSDWEPSESYLEISPSQGSRLRGRKNPEPSGPLFESPSAPLLESIRSEPQPSPSNSLSLSGPVEADLKNWAAECGSTGTRRKPVNLKYFTPENNNAFQKGEPAYYELFPTLRLSGGAAKFRGHRQREIQMQFSYGSSPSLHDTNPNKSPLLLRQVDLKKYSPEKLSRALKALHEVWFQ